MNTKLIKHNRAIKNPRINILRPVVAQKHSVTVNVTGCWFHPHTRKEIFIYIHISFTKIYYKFVQLTFFGMLLSYDNYQTKARFSLPQTSSIYNGV